jgi:hypothetical protein
MLKKNIFFVVFCAICQVTIAQNAFSIKTSQLINERSKNWTRVEFSLMKELVSELGQDILQFTEKLLQTESENLTAIAFIKQKIASKQISDYQVFNFSLQIVIAIILCTLRNSKVEAQLNF